MRQQHMRRVGGGRPADLSGEIAALADTEHPAQAIDGELRFAPSMSVNLIDFPPGKKSGGLLQDISLLGERARSRGAAD